MLPAVYQFLAIFPYNKGIHQHKPINHKRRWKPKPTHRRGFLNGWLLKISNQSLDHELSIFFLQLLVVHCRKNHGGASPPPNFFQFVVAFVILTTVQYSTIAFSTPKSKCLPTPLWRTKNQWHQQQKQKQSHDCYMYDAKKCWHWRHADTEDTAEITLTSHAGPLVPAKGNKKNGNE